MRSFSFLLPLTYTQIFSLGSGRLRLAEKLRLRKPEVKHGAYDCIRWTCVTAIRAVPGQLLAYKLGSLVPTLLATLFRKLVV